MEYLVPIILGILGSNVLVVIITNAVAKKDKEKTEPKALIRIFSEATKEQISNSDDKLDKAFELLNKTISDLTIQLKESREESSKFYTEILSKDKRINHLQLKLGQLELIVPKLVNCDVEHCPYGALKTHGLIRVPSEDEDTDF
jgi:hypothetical protein